MSDLLCCRGPGAEAGGGNLSACKGGFPGEGEIEWICVRIFFKTMSTRLVSTFFCNSAIWRRFLQFDSCFSDGLKPGERRWSHYHLRQMVFCFCLLNISSDALHQGMYHSTNSEIQAMSYWSEEVSEGGGWWCSL